MWPSQTLPRTGLPAYIGGGDGSARGLAPESSEAPTEPPGAPMGSPTCGTWTRRLWQMLQIFTESGYVSRMCCSISRMARLCRVNSPSFCRDTMEAAVSQALSC